MDSLVIGAITLALMGAALPQASGPNWQFSSHDIPGWTLMSEAERAEHGEVLTRLRSYAACRSYVAGRHRALQARAQEQGQSLPNQARANVCQRMSRAGFLR